jgi:hypothetical protein
MFLGFSGGIIIDSEPNSSSSALLKNSVVVKGSPVLGSLYTTPESSSVKETIPSLGVPSYIS